MARFIIRGGKPLRGIHATPGNKNAALPMLAACILTDQPVRLRNLPLIQDVLTMLEILQDGEAKLIVKLDRKTKLGGQIGIGLDQPAPRGLSVKYTPIPPDQSEAEVTLIAGRQAPVGRTVYVILTGTSRAGGTTTVKYAQAIPVKIIPGAATRPTTRPTTRPASQPTTKPRL